MIHALGDVLQLFQVDEKDIKYIFSSRHHGLEDSALPPKTHTALSYAMFSGEICGMRELGGIIRSASVSTGLGTKKLLDPVLVKSLLQAGDFLSRTALSKIFEASSLLHRTEVIATFAELVQLSGLSDGGKASIVSRHFTTYDDNASAALLSDMVKGNDVVAVQAYGNLLTALNLPEAMLNSLLSIDKAHAIGAEINSAQQRNHTPAVTAFLDVLRRLVSQEMRNRILGITPPGAITPETGTAAQTVNPKATLSNPPQRLILRDTVLQPQPRAKRGRFGDRSQASTRRPMLPDLNLEPEPDDPAEMDPAPPS